MVGSQPSAAACRLRSLQGISHVSWHTRALKPFPKMAMPHRLRSMHRAAPLPAKGTACLLLFFTSAGWLLHGREDCERCPGGAGQLREMPCADRSELQGRSRSQPGSRSALGLGAQLFSVRSRHLSQNSGAFFATPAAAIHLRATTATRVAPQQQQQQQQQQQRA